MERVYYRQLDGIRAISIPAVFCTHLIFTPFITKLGLGYLSVNLFFTLSGFLITEALLKQKAKNYSRKEILKNFYIRRFLRIFPIYFLLILVAFIANLDRGRELFIYNITYTINFYNAFTGYIGEALSHTWSLCVEEQFYFIWPVLILLVKPRHHKTVICSAILFAVLFRLTTTFLKIPNYSIWNYRSMPASMDSIAAGALIAYLKMYHEVFLTKILRLVIIPVVALTMYLFLAFSPVQFPLLYETFLRLCSSVCTFYLVGKAIFNFRNSFGRFLENRVVKYIGKISYGLYLYHLLIFYILTEPFENFLNSSKNWMPKIIYYNPYLLSFPLFSLATVIVAALSYTVIEVPMLNIKTKFQNKFKTKWSLN